MIISFRDLPKLPSSKFQFENSCFAASTGFVCHLDTPSGLIEVDKGWWLEGWCDIVDEHLMRDREGQVCLMFFNKEEGSIWHHYPLDTESKRDRAKFKVDGVLK